ncbi:uncharacterized protein LOC108741908 [Agrilus planipennis]|uniref:Uncharacterized protein LOC108741908 n=1 Tax=Agrilus planipennis TaxID=224129 RepID=A0A1W4XJ43_AGRPL|nr:uncharacterized protein LOC108741908 [Agrilus planipennis]
MGDNNNITVPERIEMPKASVNILRQTHPAADLSLNVKRADENTDLTQEHSSATLPASPLPHTDEKQSPELKRDDESKVETYFQKIDLDATSTSVTNTLSRKADTPMQSFTKTEAAEQNQQMLTVPRYKSEIITNKDELNGKTSATGSPNFNKMKHLSSNVFPVGCMGCKEDVHSSSSRRFLNANEATIDHVGHMENTPRKRPTSRTRDTIRNPVTGAGVENYSDKQKVPSGKRKDGNPLLGTGYEDPVRRSETRVPPGGFSQGIW